MTCTSNCNQGRSCRCGTQTPVLDFILAFAIGVALASALIVWWSA